MKYIERIALGLFIVFLILAVASLGFCFLYSCWFLGCELASQILRDLMDPSIPLPIKGVMVGTVSLCLCFVSFLIWGFVDRVTLGKRYSRFDLRRTNNDDKQ